MSNSENNEVLLRVEGLCQYFRSKNGYENKVVDNVSFDVKKGEVFGLVGESGCGKTTTGRSIIRIYDNTSGSIYFKGQRVCAGTRSDVDAIKADTDAVEKTFYKISEKLYSQQAGAQGADPNMGGAQDGTYYDANYEDNSGNNQ